MIGISTRLYDLDGSVEIPMSNLETKTNASGSRRVSKSKTLDGGVFVSDFGYSAADEDMYVVTIGLSKLCVEKLFHILKYHSEVVVATDGGVFLGVISKILQNNNKTTISITISGVA